MLAQLYRNKLKIWNFDKEAPGICSRLADAETAQLEKVERYRQVQIQWQTTWSETKFSICFGMKLIIFLMMGLLTFSSCSYVDKGWSTVSDSWDYLPDFYYFSDCPEKITLQVKTNSATNCGAPLYVLVKTSDFSSFLFDDYQKITQMVAYPNEEENEGVQVFCLVPGSSKTLRIEIPVGESIAIYALFTEPGAGWKRIFDQQLDCRNIRVFLGEHEIQSVEFM